MRSRDWNGLSQPPSLSWSLSRLSRGLSVNVTLLLPLVAMMSDVTLSSPGARASTDLTLSSFTWSGPGHRALSAWHLWESSESKSWKFLRKKYYRDLANLGNPWGFSKTRNRKRGTRKKTPKLIEDCAYQKSPSRKLTNWKQFIWSIFATSTPPWRLLDVNQRFLDFVSVFWFTLYHSFSKNNIHIFWFRWLCLEN